MTKKKSFFYFRRIKIFTFMNKNKFLHLGIRVGIHILFCLSLIYWFYTNSFIRPYAISHPYKEIICALLVLLLVYLNYLILTPYFVRNFKYKSYALFSLGATGIFALAELLIVKTDIIKCIGGSNGSFDINNYLFRTLFVIFLRNLSFYLFFTVLKLYLQTKEDALLEKKEVLKSTGLITLIPLRGEPISFYLNFVSYFSKSKNYTVVHSVNGKPVSVYYTLNAIKEYLNNSCLRVNKNIIITFTNIVSYNSNSVTVKENRKNSHKSFPFYTTEANEILFLLRKTVPELEEKDAFFSQKIENGTVNDGEKNKIDTLKKVVLEEIKQNPGINTLKIHENLQKKISLRTIKRRLKELTEEGLIERKGSDKTGGYFISSSSPANS